MNIELLKEIAVEAGNEILKIYHDERLSKEIEKQIRQFSSDLSR
jgi:hypothetical protein